MRKLLLLVVLSVIITGCTSKSDVSENKVFESQQDISERSSMEKFSMSYPEWQAAPIDDPLTLSMMVSNDGICNFRLVAAESPVEWYYLGLKNFTLNNGGTMISENPFVFETKSSDGKYTF